MIVSTQINIINQQKKSARKEIKSTLFLSLRGNGGGTFPFNGINS